MTELETRFAPLLPAPILAAERIYHGRNSQVYCFTTAAGQFVGKWYAPPRPGGRDRQAVEFQALQFMAEHDIKVIPRPLAQSPEQHCAVYEYVAGQPPSTITEAHIEQAVQFTQQLCELSKLDAAQALPLASEACFSLREIVQNLQERLARLTTVQPTTAATHALQRFLTIRFIPAFEHLREQVQAQLTSYEAVLPLQQRTLSPSDFGFHNALLTPNGQLYFLDFEYFGWDDPAKLISDFLWHPAMSLSTALKKLFLNRLLTQWGNQPALTTRLQVVYPLYGLKWCIIMLNEFLATDLARRQHATQAEDVQQRQLAQLAKAEHLLTVILETYPNFPYQIG